MRLSQRGSERDTAKQLLGDLEELRNSFDKDATSSKLRLVRGLHRTEILSAKELLAYHERLCFMRAYPDSPQVLREAEEELRRFGQRVERYRKESRDKPGAKLTGSGIVNTTTNYPFGYDIVRMLAAWYPGAVEIDWEGTDKGWLVKLFNALPLMVSWEENDILDNDLKLEPRIWLRLSGGPKNKTGLEGLLRLFEGSTLPEKAQRYFYEDLGLFIKWNLTDSPASRTLRRLPWKRVFYQQEAFRGRSKNLLEALKQPAGELRLLSEAEGRKLVRVINEALAVRDRELYPTTFANPREAYVNEPGRGMQIYLFGTEAEYRLPLEVNYGALLVRNGMPIGYGVAVCLFEQVEIAINIFPAFRGGESAAIIEQFFRIFYQHFGSRILVVRRKQMGYQEDEALYSGAFWFYYKLGFRALSPGVRKLADRENEKITSRRGYKVPIDTMRRLAKSDVVLLTSGESEESFQELSIVNLGYHVTQYFGGRFGGDRARGTGAAMQEVKKVLGIAKFERWTEDERVALERLAPLVALIPRLRAWGAQEKKGLVEVIRAKGGKLERRFVLASIRHPELKRALESLAKVRPA